MDQLFLVGDIVDIWSLRRSFYWPQIHNDVLRTILGKTKHGTRVIYVPGNHDEQLREICGSSFGNLEIHREYVHTTLRDLELLVMHGDEFDGAVKCSRWLTALGSGLYDVTLGANRCVERLAPPPRLSLLVAGRLSQEPSRQRDEVRSWFRAGGRPGGPPSRRRRHRLRAHSSARDRRARRHALLQRWRLGR